MSAPKGARFRSVCYIIEGLNSFAVTLYGSYLYFHLREHFGFHDRDNLLVAALLGVVYVVVAWKGGQFAQRHGYFTSLKVGLVMMMCSLAAGSQLGTAFGQIAAACGLFMGQCFMWPALEALVSEGETSEQLPRAIGIYNVTWAVTAALAFFTGGTLLAISFKNLFFVPLCVQAVQLVLVFWLQNHATELARAAVQQLPATPPPDPHRPTPVRAKSFLRMAWLANPFAYIAINTLIAVMPSIAAKFQLSNTFAGIVCSTWYFARMGAFVLLWHWTAWHYRFRWLLAAYLLLIATFTAILMAPTLAVLVAGQIFFGGAVGLIYYSSLFYSMDASDTKGEHGGIHEAAIGLGNFLGPATGAAALWLAPGNATVGVCAVSGLLTFGLCGLIWIQQRAVRDA